MSAFIHNAAIDASDLLSGFRSSLPTGLHVIEAVALASVVGFTIVCLNALF